MRLALLDYDQLIRDISAPMPALLLPRTMRSRTSTSSFGPLTRVGTITSRQGSMKSLAFGIKMQMLTPAGSGTGAGIRGLSITTTPSTRWSPGPSRDCSPT